jgi:flagellar biosynthesis protein FlhG
MSGSHIMSPPRGMLGVSQVDALLGRGPRDRTPYGNAARGATTLLMASGRGGSGTSLVSLLFAVAAAGDGRRVLLIDADDFVGPLALTLGLQVRASWQDLRGGRMAPAEVATPVSTTLTLVAGGAPRLSTHELALTAAERRACLRRLAVLADGMDLVVIDCGARIDTVLAAITPHADERLVAIAAGSDPVGLASTYALCKAVHTRYGALPLDVLVNRHEGSDAARCFDTIAAGARQFLGMPLRLAGSVPSDPTLDAALRAGMPFPHAAAGSPAAIAAHDVVMRALTTAALSRSGT